MSKKEIAKAMYLAGEKPCEIAKKLKYRPGTISTWACEEKWSEEKIKKAKETMDSLEKEIKDLTQLALTTLNDILTNENVRYSDKVAATRAVLDISGLKRDNKDVNLNAEGFEVIINQIPVRNIKEEG